MREQALRLQCDAGVHDGLDRLTGGGQAGAGEAFDAVAEPLGIVGGAAGPEPYRTPEGVTANVMEKLGAEWHDWTAHDDTYVVEGANVVVLARYTAVHKGTGKPINVRVAHHFVMRGGRIVLDAMKD
ncbi:MAG TPA: nuclear transport factor 2 family protein [Pseudonocardiaceae bacterium]|nr:nuclear transport factor 2 family protein [Pseudonocardiaceae bacterium]